MSGSTCGTIIHRQGAGNWGYIPGTKTFNSLADIVVADKAPNPSGCVAMGAPAHGGIPEVPPTDVPRAVAAQAYRRTWRPRI